MGIAFVPAAAEEAVANQPGPDEPEHDFGAVLARDQTLCHEFALSNPTDRAIGLLDAVAMTPCCSTIGPLPDAIPPGGTVAVPVTFKPGHSSGRKRVEFAVRTDFADRPVWSLSVSAALTPDLAYRLNNGSDSVLRVGQSGRQVLSIACRRRGDEGRDAPDSVEAVPPLSARFLGSAQVSERPGGVVEAIQDVEILLPASTKEGPKRGTIRFHWGSGESRDHTVTWDVTPRIQASPPGLVLKSSSVSEPQTVVLSAVDRPFRILKVSGARWDDASMERASAPKQRHSVSLILDPDLFATARTADVTMTTDDPDQPTVIISVHILPGGPGASR